ncbi:hypothetical protein TNCV_2258741, partial [Trichonephila clavipes]
RRDDVRVPGVFPRSLRIPLEVLCRAPRILSVSTVERFISFTIEIPINILN